MNKIHLNPVQNLSAPTEAKVKTMYWWLYTFDYSLLYNVPFIYGKFPRKLLLDLYECLNVYHGTETWDGHLKLPNFWHRCHCLYFDEWYYQNNDVISPISYTFPGLFITLEVLHFQVSNCCCCNASSSSSSSQTHVFIIDNIGWQ